MRSRARATRFSARHACVAVLSGCLLGGCGGAALPVNLPSLSLPAPSVPTLGATCDVMVSVLRDTGPLQRDAAASKVAGQRSEVLANQLDAASKRATALADYQLAAQLEAASFAARNWQAALRLGDRAGLDRAGAALSVQLAALPGC